MKQQNDLQPIQNVYFIRQTPYILLKKLLVMEILFLFFYLVFRLPKFFVIGNISQNLFYDWSVASIYFLGMISTVQLVATVLITISWTNEYYTIRPSEILHRRGIFTLKEETFSLKNVEAFTVDQSFIGKLLNFGTIKFFSPVLKQDYYLTRVPSPVRLKETIEKTVDSFQSNNSMGNREVIVPLRNK